MYLIKFKTFNDTKRWRILVLNQMSNSITVSLYAGFGANVDTVNTMGQYYHYLQRTLWVKSVRKYCTTHSLYDFSKTVDLMGLTASFKSNKMQHTVHKTISILAC